MRVIKIQRSIRKWDDQHRRAGHQSIRDFGREFFAKENHIEFALEALLFGVLVVISAWPIAAAAGAIGDLL
jgi:hypothetical protein